MTEADQKIRACVDGAKSFLLDAGAGSGKTYSLIAALTYIRGGHRARLIQNSQRVACITFTNVAKDEIIERTEHDPLFFVSTIHDFLWMSMKGFVQELRSALLTHNANLPPNSKRKVPQEDLAAAMRTIKVAYSDRGSKFLEGRIFHDDLLEIASIMFSKHSLLGKLVAARFPFVFVDEYQDTNEKVISILLNGIRSGGALIGFFGDKMQSIYSDGVGEIPAEFWPSLETIKKEENYRCSKAVISLLNKIRGDIQQNPAGKNKDGRAVYVNLSNGNTGDVLERAKELTREQFGWSEDGGESKYLFLTHRLIAGRAGYPGLWKAYNDRGGFYQDRFQSGEDGVASFFLEKVEPLVIAWKEGRTGKVISLLNSDGDGFANPEVKKATVGALDKLVALTDSGDVRSVLLHLVGARLLKLPDVLSEHLNAAAPSDSPDEEDKEGTFFAALMKVAYKEVSAYRQVFEKHLPYSTKHGVKGDEFDTVFVILDDAGARWNQYSFGNFLAGSEANADRLSRTRNLFYVCCSRSKDRLAVVDLGKVQAARAAIEALFGAENCVF